MNHACAPAVGWRRLEWVIVPLVFVVVAHHLTHHHLTHAHGQPGMLYRDSGDGGNCCPPRLLSKMEDSQREAKADGDRTN